MNQRTSAAIVYLIEDDVALADSMGELFTSLNYEFQHFLNGEDFFQLIAAHPEAVEQSACLVCDFRLPGMTGFEVFENIQTNYPQTCWSILMMTGHADVNMAVSAIKSGAFDFVTKPFDPFDLIKKIAAALQQSKKIKTQKDFCKDFDHRHEALTKQEKLVMKKILHNMANREIADELEVSSRTVEIHRSNVFKKMHVSSALELSQQYVRYVFLTESSKN